MRDFISTVQTVDLTTDTLSGTTPNASSWLDTLGFDAATIEVWTNTVTDAGTAAGFTATLQHSDLITAVSAVDVPAAETVGGVNTVTVTSDDADNVLAGSIGYLGNKRYIRVNYVGTSGTNASVRTVGRLTRPHRAPTTYIGAGVAAT
jgi:hypothetical protein